MSKEIVYKKDVLDILSMMPTEEGITRALLTQSVKQLPSAQPEPHWIPCSERMPELDSDGYSDKVLVCFSNFPGVEICEYRVMNGTGKWYAGDTDDSPEDIGVNVIAWQPLPEPYREDGNE